LARERSSADSRALSFPVLPPPFECVRLAWRAAVCCDPARRAALPRGSAASARLRRRRSAPRSSVVGRQGIWKDDFATGHTHCTLMFSSFLPLLLNLFAEVILIHVPFPLDFGITIKGEYTRTSHQNWVGPRPRQACRSGELAGHREPGPDREPRLVRGGRGVRSCAGVPTRLARERPSGGDARPPMPAAPSRVRDTRVPQAARGVSLRVLRSKRAAWPANGRARGLR